MRNVDFFRSQRTVDAQKFMFKKIVSKTLPFFPVLLVALLWFAKDYPARMSSDSITSWDQVVNGNYKNDHLVVYTLYLKMVSLNGLALWFVPIFQILLTIFTFDKILRLLKFSRFRRSLVLFFSFLTPVVGGFIVTIWKDVPFTIFLILGCAYFSQYLKNESKRDGFLGFFYLTFGISFRHNGWVLAIFFIIFIVVFVGKQFNRVQRARVAAIVIVSVVTSQVISAIAVQMTNAAREPAYVYSLSFAADLAYIASAHPDKADQKVLDIVSKFSTGESFQGASNCTGVGYLIIPPGFNQDGLADNARKVLMIWVENLPKNFGLIFEARKCRALPFIPPPFIKHPVHPTWLFPGIYEPNSFGLHTTPQQGFIFKALQSWEVLWQKHALIVAWPAALGSIGIFFSFLIKRKKPETAVILAFLNALIAASLVSLWFVSLSPDYRYAAISQFLGVLIGISGLAGFANFHSLNKWRR